MDNEFIVIQEGQSFIFEKMPDGSLRCRTTYRLDPGRKTCSCPRNKLQRKTCKHIKAARKIGLFAEQNHKKRKETTS